MSEYRLGEIETKFADLIWKNSPIPSGELVKLAEIHLGWKKSTTYTILKRLCDRGIFQNQKGTVSSLVSKEEIQRADVEELVEKRFGGSIPAFIAAFSGDKKLTDEEIAKIRDIIEK